MRRFLSPVLSQPFVARGPGYALQCRARSAHLLVADVIDGKLKAVPRGVMAAGNIMQGGRGGIDLPPEDVGRVKSHLAKYYKKMDDTPPWAD